jgi:hypothetical protein
MGLYFQTPYRGSKLVKLIEVVQLIKATQKTSLLLVVSIVCGFHPNWLIPENHDVCIAVTCYLMSSGCNSSSWGQL